MGQEARSEAGQEGQLHFQVSTVLGRRTKCLSRAAADCQNANDFDRFKIQLAKKNRRDLVRKAYVKEKKASA